MRYPFLCCLLLFSVLCTAQDAPTWELSGVVNDAETGLPLAGVNIEWEAEEKGTTTDENGTFALTINDLPAEINISYLGYESLQLLLATPRERNMTIALQPTALLLPEATVSAAPIIEKITEKVYTVRDFVFYGDQILLLTRIGLEDGNNLTLIDFDGNTIFEKSIKDIKSIVEMKRSCLGHIHLLTGWKDYEVVIDSTGISVLPEQPRWKYERYLEPCTDASEEYIYHQQWTNKKQVLHYTAFSKTDGEAIDFQVIADIENLSKYNEDYQSNVAMGGSAISWAAFEQLFYRPINAPLFNVGEELCIFNHLDGFLEFYTFTAEGKRAIPIQYHLDKKWDEQIFWDAADQAAYALFDMKNGKVLRKINLKTGKLGFPWRIPCQYIEKMTVYGGHLFYLESGILEHERNRVLHKVRLVD